MTANIVDSTGRPIEKGMIVGMADPDGNWLDYQGIVIEVKNHPILVR
ncbi:hypothetical protein ACFL05_00135 [Patescibacteria group bacterium]